MSIRDNSPESRICHHFKTRRLAHQRVLLRRPWAISGFAYDLNPEISGQIAESADRYLTPIQFPIGLIETSYAARSGGTESRWAGI
jgi:hypothetical protein